MFVAPKTMKGPDWPSEKIDYVMLSALSCSPTMLFYLPTKTGIPTEDKAEIRKWLEWGPQEHSLFASEEGFGAMAGGGQSGWQRAYP